MSFELPSFIRLCFVLPAGRFNQNMHEGAIDFSALLRVCMGDLNGRILPVYDVIGGILVFPFLCFSCNQLANQILGRIRRSGGNLQQLLVVGAGDLGREVVERLQQHLELGFAVVGFLDDDPGKQQRKVHGAQVLGTTADLERVVEERQVDQVVIALPLSAHQKTIQLIRRAGQLLLEVKVVPDLLQYYVLRAGVEDLDGLPVINLTQIPLQGWNQIAKRSFDIVGSVTLLVLTGWMFPIIAWFIKREDGGPIFFSQVRTGMDGRSFRLHKFRSMRVNASDEAQWTRTKDPRITPVGAILRRFNFDELPQLINDFADDIDEVGMNPFKGF